MVTFKQHLNEAVQYKAPFYIKKHAPSNPYNGGKMGKVLSTNKETYKTVQAAQDACFDLNDMTSQDLEYWTYDSNGKLVTD